MSFYFSHLPPHQVVPIGEDNTSQAFLDSMNTVAPEVITVGVIDFHLRGHFIAHFSKFWGGFSPRRGVALSRLFPQPAEALSPHLSPPLHLVQVKPNAPQVSQAAFFQTAPAARAQPKIVLGTGNGNN